MPAGPAPSAPLIPKLPFRHLDLAPVGHLDAIEAVAAGTPGIGSGVQSAAASAGGMKGCATFAAMETAPPRVAPV